ncbi:MAG: hypothetical protein LBJ36_06960 [Synergistaceae bacterium]|nr:hypothetical protein [Synergistaceae bacterium]
MSFVVLLRAAVSNSGYVMGNGHSPFWLHSETGLRRVAGWILNVPSG